MDDIIDLFGNIILWILLLIGFIIVLIMSPFPDFIVSISVGAGVFIILMFMANDIFKFIEKKNEIWKEMLDILVIVMMWIGLGILNSLAVIFFIILYFLIKDSIRQKYDDLYFVSIISLFTFLLVYVNLFFLQELGII